MKKLFSILIAFLVLLPAMTAQENEACYNRLVEEGIAAYDTLAFDLAIAKFEAASICDDRPLNLEPLNILLVKARNGYIEELKRQKREVEEARNQAIAERNRADSARVVAEANRLALLANNELEAGNDTSAIILAYSARRLMNDMPSAPVKYAFGQAVFSFFTQAFEQDAMPVYSLTPIPGQSSFLVEMGQGYIGHLLPEAGTLATISPPDDFLSSVNIASRTTRLLITSSGPSAQLWNLTTGTQETPLNGHKAGLTFGIFSPDESLILTGSRDKTARLWNGQRNTSTLLQGHQGYVYEGRFSKDNRLLTRSSDGTVRVWNEQGQLLAIIDGHRSYINSAAFSPDGKSVLTASSDGSARLWRLDGKEAAVFSHGSVPVKAALFAPDGMHVLTLARDNNPVLWNLQGDKVVDFSGHTKRVNTIDFNERGDRILTTSRDGTVRIWTLEGRTLLTLDHESDVLSAAWSPDERLILTTTREGITKLWDDRGDLLQTINLNSRPAVRSVFSGDGKYIAVVTENRKVVTYPVPEVAVEKLREEKLIPRSKIKTLEQKHGVSLGMK